jgi:hypothetical protein
VRDRNDYVSALDYGDPFEPVGPVRIVGARNGSHCGQLVLGCDEALRGVKVSASELRTSSGHVIPASNVSILYGRMGSSWCDAFTDRVPEKVALHKKTRMALLPVLARVKVPRDARPGDYTGTLTLTANGTALRRPLELHVCDWVVPDPADYRVYTDLYQSPTTVALQYETPMWSEAHWKRLERSWELLGRAGNKLVVVHAAEETQFGNRRGTIHWVKQPDGSYVYDFSIFDRYMALALEHCGRLDHVAVQLWHVGNIHKTGKGWAASRLDQKVTVTVRDEATGKLGSLRVPTFCTEQSKTFWKPFPPPWTPACGRRNSTMRSVWASSWTPCPPRNSSRCSTRSGRAAGNPGGCAGVTCRRTRRGPSRRTGRATDVSCSRSTAMGAA